MKRMYFYVLSALIFGTFCMTGCDKKEDCCVNIDTAIGIYYKTEIGENLINSTEEYDESGIKIYYKNGDEYEFAYNGNLDAPGMYRLEENHEDKLIMSVFPSDYYEGKFSTTLVELNSHIVDTLVCEFLLTSNSTICINASLNGVAMDDRYIEVVK